LSDLISIPCKDVIDSIIKIVILIFKKLDEDYFNSACRIIITLFGDITFKKLTDVEKNGKYHFYYIDSLLNIPPRVILDNVVINELLLLV